MSVTKQIQRHEWQRYFDDLVKRHLRGDSQNASVSIEVLSPSLGEQPEVTTARLVGLTYDPKSNALEMMLEDVDHLVFYPAEIWVVEEDDGVVSALEVVRSDGTREIMRLQRSGAAASVHATP
jgi:hypothetical protein